MKENINLFRNPSVCGINWQYEDINNNNINLLKERFNVSISIAKIIASRHPSTKDLNNLIKSSLKENIPNPNILKDLNDAVGLIYLYLKKKKKVGILGDYDVDGCSSAALIHNYLNEIDIKTTVYIPNRLADGYGASKKAIEFFYKNKVALLITLDCGTNDFEAIEYAKKKSIKIIVIDHHEVKKKANACYIINPKQKEDKSNLKHLSTVGLCFIFIIGLHKKLANEKYFINNKIPDLRYLLDMVALGTVCDQVPIKGLNRIFVKKGLSVINKRYNNGLSLLAKKLKLNNNITENELGYYLGPCINAAGRIGNAYMGFELLSNNKKISTIKIVDELIRNNKERRTIEEIAFRQAIETINKENILSLNENLFILLENKNWHPGIIGIIASKLLEKYNLPCFIVSSYGNKSRGSVRTPSYLDTSEFLKKMLDMRIILSGGGHKMAGGFVIEKNNLDKLRHNLILELKKHKFEKNECLFIDAITDISSINEKFFEDLGILGPFGVENREPTFVIKNLKPLFYNLIGKNKKHVSCILEDIYGLKINAVAFNAFENKIGHTIMKMNNMHVAGKLKINQWKMKKNIQLVISDILTI